MSLEHTRPLNSARQYTTLALKVSIASLTNRLQPSIVFW